MVSSEIDLPADYADLLEELKTRISGARIHAQGTVNLSRYEGPVVPEPAVHDRDGAGLG